MQKSIVLSAAFLTAILFTSVSVNASPSLWVLEVGQTWIYEETDTSGSSSTLQFYVYSQVSLDSTPFGIGGLEDYYYLDGSISHNVYVRATDSAVYGWADGDAFKFELGTDWVGPTEAFSYLGTESISLPYGGPYASYKWKGEDVSPGTGYWYDYFVPNIGHVQHVDEYGNIVKLVDIIPASVPVPGAIWLLGSGILALASIPRRL